MTDDTFLPPAMVEAVERGRAILFLGAGATRGAKTPNGEDVPDGSELRDRISDKFLAGELADRPLSHVAEIAKNETNIGEVQSFIRQQFMDLEPADFHRLVPTFRWYAIVSTNYDLVLESAYSSCQDREQTLAPIVRDGDNFADQFHDQSKVVYLKLHGCINHISDEGIPLILATEEYAKHKRNRERLFGRVSDWGRDLPIIFCGYKIADPNIQQIFFDLADLGVRRPAYALVDPGLDQYSIRYWNSKRVFVVPISFEQFLCELDRRIPRAQRKLAALIEKETTPLDPWIATSMEASDTLRLYLEREVELIHKGMATSGVTPEAFYTGLSNEWGAFEKELDVRRRISDDVILDSHLDATSHRSNQLFLVKGHAGSGKSVCLRRVAWDIANDYEGLVFWLREGGKLSRAAIEEIHELTRERVLIIVEDVIQHLKELEEVANWSRQSETPVSLVFGARTNEWNVYGGDLEQLVANEYELRDLSEREILSLLEKLEQHGSLGHLKNASEEERVSHFHLTAERQLLVALHDLNKERPFERIIFDEYNNITPPEARLLYLDVCTLHRFGVGVRAGLISRVSGINFEHFSKNFFRPLEHVVRTYFDYQNRDNMYRSRHRLIAEMVIKQVLADPAERAAQITRLIRSMDVDFESDGQAFREIVHGRNLADLFASKQLALQVFQAALEAGADVRHVEHQRAVFELNHPSGSVNEAFAAIGRAEAASERNDRAVLHTKAMILRQLALNAVQPLQRQKWRDEAKDILRRQTRGSKVAHPFHLAGLLALDELKEELGELESQGGGQSETLRERRVADIMKVAEQAISDGLQKFPADEYLLNLEAQLAQVLENDVRMRSALERAFQASPGRSFIAIRLAALKLREDHSGEAVEILKKSLSANPTNKQAHLALAKALLKRDGEGNRGEILHHLKRSFIPGDSNFEAQYWFARQSFLYGDREEAQRTFENLAEVPRTSGNRGNVRDFVADEAGGRRRLSGLISSCQSGYAFIDCQELRTDIFAHRTQFWEGEFVKLRKGVSVTFSLGFTWRGPAASQVQVGR